MKIIYDSETNQFLVIIGGRLQRTLTHRETANILTELINAEANITIVMKALKKGETND